MAGAVKLARDHVGPPDRQLPVPVLSVLDLPRRVGVPDDVDTIVYVAQDPAQAMQGRQAFRRGLDLARLEQKTTGQRDDEPVVDTLDERRAENGILFHLNRDDSGEVVEVSPLLRRDHGQLDEDAGARILGQQGRVEVERERFLNVVPLAHLHRRHGEKHNEESHQQGGEVRERQEPGLAREAGVPLGLGLLEAQPPPPPPIEPLSVAESRVTKVMKTRPAPPFLTPAARLSPGAP